MTTVDSPGPARYRLPDSVGGKQPLGKMNDPPVWSFTKDKRAEPKLPITSPGPVYDLSTADKHLGTGPKGIGSEYSFRPSHRVALEQRTTKQVFFPGPQYEIPTCLGVQHESTKRSYGAGKISLCPRKTIDNGPERSPGPAAYDRTSLGCVTVAKQKKPGLGPATGMGGAERFFNRETRTGAVPGPGAYKIPTCIGGTTPDLPAKPVFPFNKDDARHVHSSRIFSPDPCSPGPHAKYKTAGAFGQQASDKRPSSAAYGFGTGSRFQCSAEENRQHREALMAMHRARRAELAAERMGERRPSSSRL